MRNLYSLLLLIIVFSVYPSSASIVEDACKNISSSHPDITYEFCIKSFENNVDSSLVEDQRTLAIIAVEMANITGVKLQSKLKDLIVKEKNEARRNRLGVCMELYKDAIDELDDATRAIDWGRDEDAHTFLSAALDASSNCEDAFSEAEDASPLEEEDTEYGRVAAIALAIVAALH